MAKQPTETIETMSIPEAGWEFYGLGEGASYAAAKRGQIPYIQIGKKKRVPRILMKRRMETPDNKEEKP
jgi:hypothetical protein